MPITTCKLCPKAAVAMPLVLLSTVMGRVVRKLPVVDLPLCHTHRQSFKLADWMTDDIWIRMKNTAADEPEAYQPFRPATKVRFVPWKGACAP